MREITTDPNCSLLESPTHAPRVRTAKEITHGAKLLCIDDANLRRHYTPESLRRGQLYCVRELYHDDGVPGVLLAGIFGPVGSGGLECGFLLSRFRWVHD